MLLRTIPVFSIFLLAACSTGAINKGGGSTGRATSSVEYANGNSKIIPVNPVTSSNNACVDRFNFLRQAGNDKYQKYSRDYIEIGKGFSFLNTNKNIMSTDARRVYTNTLDMKLSTLCSDVNYAGFALIQQKISALSNI